MFSWIRIEPSTSDKEGAMLVVDKRREGEEGKKELEAWLDKPKRWVVEGELGEGELMGYDTVR